VSYSKGAERRRLQRIRFRENWSPVMWIVLIIFVVMILMAPKLAELHEEFHRRQRGFLSHEHPSDAMASGGVPAAIAR
jgi:hypothetical protein